MKQDQLTYTIHNEKGEMLKQAYDKNGKRVIQWTNDYKYAWKIQSLPVLRYVRNEIVDDPSMKW